MRENVQKDLLYQFKCVGALLASTFALSACVTSSPQNITAMAVPPTQYPVIVERVEKEDVMRDFDADGLSNIAVAAGPSVATIAANGVSPNYRSDESVPGNCRMQDRFDRKYALAYQWGREGRSKLGLDVDGISHTSMQVEAVKVEYVLRLQAHKPRKERCRHNSSWQGLVGTGYHEFFRRENDTVWDDLKTIRQDVGARLDTLLD